MDAEWIAAPLVENRGIWYAVVKRGREIQACDHSHRKRKAAESCALSWLQRLNRHGHRQR